MDQRASFKHPSPYKLPNITTFDSPQNLNNILLMAPPILGQIKLSSSSGNLNMSQKLNKSQVTLAEPPNLHKFDNKSCSNLNKSYRQSTNVHPIVRQQARVRQNISNKQLIPSFLNVENSQAIRNITRKYSTCSSKQENAPKISAQLLLAKIKQNIRLAKSSKNSDTGKQPSANNSFRSSETSSFNGSTNKIFQDIISSPNSSKSSGNGVMKQERKSHLFIPVSARIKTHSLQKDQKTEKINKVPAFIRTKHSQLQDMARKTGSSTEKNVNIYSSLNLQNQEQFNEIGCSFQINIKPAVKKRTIDDFLMIKQLGSGSFGEAFIAVQKSIGFICVIKILQKDKIVQYQTENSLLRQIKIQIFLQHKHLTSLYGCFDDQTKVYLILQLLPTGNLKQKVKNKALPQKAVSSIIYQICSGISYMHDHSIIHRDIKPQNIFTNENYIKLGDFGCAIYCDDRRRSFVGSPCYLSPQQLRQEEYDQKIDMWQIGTIMYELLFKACPFEQDILEIAQGQRPATFLSELYFPVRYVVSDEAKDFMSRALQKNSSLRMSVDEALKHKFFNRHHEDSEIGKCLQ